MAIEFFDKLTASVSKTVKQASDGAKVLADKNRVRKDIASAENELRARFHGDFCRDHCTPDGDRRFAEGARAPDRQPHLQELRQELCDRRKILPLLRRAGACL